MGAPRNNTMQPTLTPLHSEAPFGLRLMVDVMRHD
jgi:hypothetical protein